MTVVWSSASATVMNVVMAPTSIDPAAASEQHDVLPPPQILRDTIRHVVGLINASQKQPQLQMPSQAYANYAMVLIRWVFLLEGWVPHQFLYFGVCYCVCFLLSGSECGCHIHNVGLTVGVCTTATHWSIPMVGKLPPGNGLFPMPGVHWVSAP